MGDERMSEHGFDSRHLLADTAKNTTQKMFNNTCVLMYASSIKYTAADGNSTEFITSSAGQSSWKVGGCGSHNLGCSISLEKMGNVGKYTNATLLVEFKNDTQSWFCDFIRFSWLQHGTNKPFETTFDCGGNSSTGFQSPVYNVISAPLGMSYACYDMTFIHNGTALHLGGFQVQTFCDGKPMSKAFSGAYNCVGFFTIPILTGIFVTIVLMIGLYIGIMMMLAIQVQDRYDDPKGKTISTVTSLNE